MTSESTDQKRIVHTGNAATNATKLRTTEFDRLGLKRLLDDTHKLLSGQHRVSAARKAVEDLVIGLSTVERRCDEESWIHVLAPECRRHPVSALLAEDPYTRRALEKPRGFAGDAVMLDFLYDESPGPNVSPFGAEVFKATALTSSGQSVVERRELIASRITDTTKEKANPRILSMACGHARELDLLDDSTIGRIGEFIGIDQDEAALANVQARNLGAQVSPIRGSVRDVIAGRVDTREIDLAYAAGLLDYLSDSVSKRLIRKLCESLSPGGRLLVGNFTPGNWGRGYMDSFMEWHLTYRTTADLREIGRTAGIARELLVERVFEDRLGNVAYLELTVA